MSNKLKTWIDCERSGCDGTATKQLDNLNIEKQHCMVHMARCQKRRVIGVKLSNSMVGTCSSDIKIHMRFKQKLARAISRRCTIELATARRLYQ